MAVVSKFLCPGFLEFDGISLPQYLGSVSVPLPKFADGIANEFKLPLFTESSNGSDPECLLAFTIQTSVPLTCMSFPLFEIADCWVSQRDINKLLTEEEIDTLYNAMGLGKGESLTPRDFTAGEKWALVPFP